VPEVLAPADGEVITANGDALPVDRAINTMASVLYDAVAVAGGADSVAALCRGYAMHFVAEVYKHAKPVAAFGVGVDLLDHLGVTVDLASGVSDQGVVTSIGAENAFPSGLLDAFADEIGKHRAWERETDTIPA
jgi:catalase